MAGDTTLPQWSSDLTAVESCMTNSSDSSCITVDSLKDLIYQNTYARPTHPLKDEVYGFPTRINLKRDCPYFLGPNISLDVPLDKLKWRPQRREISSSESISTKCRNGAARPKDLELCSPSIRVWTLEHHKAQLFWHPRISQGPGRRDLMMTSLIPMAPSPPLVN
ncbi:hypothetical protein Acr_00g0054010 [Actinidia rufa]|uniref:Uncharacterized protein n=1 Tax=Actinidia rufa TaxID=165716 RepID=A0A7J0DLH4_9ERIC|nr:hypothetical protein Acr_00g0054010 [Actinidia rufa]